MENKLSKVLIIGAGLAGCEAAWFLAERKVKVIVIEEKRIKKNPAQKSDNLAELVCTNSLKSKDPNSAHGLLKLEMISLGSLILDCAQKSAVGAGDALAVDRELFSGLVTQKISSHPFIELINREATDPEQLKNEFKADHVIVATGPLTSKNLENWILKNISSDDYYFYDAIAPVVDADSLDYSKLYFKDRHKETTESQDYLNAPMNKDEYYNFINELKNAQKVAPKEFEDYKFFEACLPIDLMAQRGDETARFSCMKPIGLELPDGKMPYAVVQLRKENLLGSAYNLVGFQTRLTYPEQLRVLRLIPGLENAQFLHLGSVHRNSFLNSRKLLRADLSSIKYPWLSFAGQMTGVEGYTESASCGLYVGFQVSRKLKGLEILTFPVETAMGALINYLMTLEKPVPSSFNFGLLPALELTKDQRKMKDRKKTKKIMMGQRAQQCFKSLLVHLE